jgi:hypothetical protein
MTACRTCFAQHHYKQSVSEYPTHLFPPFLDKLLSPRDRWISAQSAVEEFASGELLVSPLYVPCVLLSWQAGVD